MTQHVLTVRTPTLEIAYRARGPVGGIPVVLMHGFPDDPGAYDGTLDELEALGCRVFAPWLRGYGPTRFLDAATPRSGQQAALGADLLAFMDALELDSAVLVGYDWGGRAACIVAALWPERCRGLVTVGAYNIQDIANADRPAPVSEEYRYWYQWYFNTERGRAGLEQDRRAICRLLWQLWSPSWSFDDEMFDRTAASFDNPDFVDVVTHSYRHRIGNAPGEPRFRDIETRLAQRPPITVPSIVLYGADDGVVRPTAEASAAERAVFPELVARRVIPGVGHFMPREAPAEMASALLELLERTRERK